MTRPPVNRIVIVALAAVLGGLPVQAQSTPPDPNPDDQAPGDQPAEPGLLRGPKVPREAGDETGPPGGGERGRRPLRVPPRQWFALLRQLGLGEQQQGEVDAILQELQKATREHEQEYGEQIRQLRGKIRGAREAGEQPPRELWQELRRLGSLGPKVGQYQQRIWGLLNEAQQEQMRAALKGIRKRMAERRAARGDDTTAEPKRGPALDEPARRRLAFLLARQSSKRRLSPIDSEPQPGPPVQPKRAEDDTPPGERR